ncbi:MAG: flippase-like domain-containing protein [Clostridia bacterium]|nr:flippase-like domain-containing protein [Clostridia bacterium]
MKTPKQMIEGVKESFAAFKENKKLYNIVRLSVSAAITVLVIILTVVALRDLDFSTIAHVEYNWGLFVFALPVFLAGPFFKSASMAFGYAKGDMKYFDALKVTVIGNGLNLVLPFKLGEGVRLSLYPHGMTVAKRARYFGMMLACEAVMLLIFMILSGVLHISQNNHITEEQRYFDFWLPAFFILLGVLAAAITVALIFKSTRELLTSLVTTEKGINSLIFSVLSWTSTFIAIILVLLSFSNISFFTAFKIASSVIVFINLAILIPSTPGQLGIFELSVMLSFLAFGQPLTAEQGIVAGLILHLVYYICLLPFTAVLWLIHKAKQRRLEKAESAAIVSKED